MKYNLWTLGDCDRHRISICDRVQGLSVLQWQQWFLGTAWAGPRSCSAQCWLETLLWCLPSRPYPSWLKGKMEKTDFKNKKKNVRTSDEKWQSHWHQRRTCNIHFSYGQRSQVGRGECIKTPSVHLGHTIPSVEFVVEIQANLNRERHIQYKIFAQNKIP